MDDKLFRDPIYGYLNIPSDLMDAVIDTAVFQRLRRVTQTSYSPLFASSIHNRFTHSLGVYHLGTIAVSSVAEALEASLPDDKKQIIERYKYIFLLACLLHDVGHAPFSHTGEYYYLDTDTTGTRKFAELHKKLCDVVRTESIKADIPNDPKAAAPHEIMSAIVGLRQFGSLLSSDDEREFFARCITGYAYEKAKEDREDQSIRNCFVSLLNSKVIDVDRLDYLIRDAYFTGFDTVSIDYRRLLTSLTVTKKAVEETDDYPAYFKYELAYRKGAISVIESVVFAHDSERKWIQTHPTVQYESYLIQHIIQKLHEYYEQKNIRLFSEEALSKEGCDLGDGTKIRLLCDDDIISLMKRIPSDDELSEEYFERRNRPRSLWKNEPEYHALELQYASSDGKEKLLKALKETEKHIRTHSASWIIDEHSIESFRKEAESEATTPQSDRMNAEAVIRRRSHSSIEKVMTCLESCFKKYDVPCKCIILNASQFSSGFDRPDLKELNIVFSSGAEPRRFSDVVTSLQGDSDSGKDFFYLFFHLPPDKLPELETKLKKELRQSLFQLFSGSD